MTSRQTPWALHALSTPVSQVDIHHLRSVEIYHRQDRFVGFFTHWCRSPITQGVDLRVSIRLEIGVVLQTVHLTIAKHLLFFLNSFWYLTTDCCHSALTEVPCRLAVLLKYLHYLQDAKHDMSVTVIPSEQSMEASAVFVIDATC